MTSSTSSRPDDPPATVEQWDAFNDEPYAHHWFEKTLDPANTPTA